MPPAHSLALTLAVDRASPTSATNLALERQIAQVRWWGIVLCSIAAPFLHLGNTLPVVYALIATGGLYNLIFSRLVASGRPVWLLTAYAYGLFDIMVATGLIAATGGVDSQFYPVYFLVVVHAAVRFGRRIALLSSAVACLCYLLVAVLVQSAGPVNYVIILFRLGCLLLTALFASYLADRAHAAELALAGRLDQASALQAAGAVLGESLDVAMVMQRIAEQGRVLARADVAIVEPRTPATDDALDILPGVGRATAVLPRGAYLAKVFLQSELLARLVPPDGDHVTIRSLPAAQEILGERAADLPPGALLRAPLLARGHWVGDLLLLRAVPAAPFTPADADVVRVFLNQAGLALENARLYARTREQALTDALTGLANHGALKERLGEELSRSRRHDRSLCVLLLDLDHFKRFNDTFGHASGDQALRAVADVLRHTVRHDDYAARYGGEEMAVVLPDTDAVSGMALAERIRVAVAELGEAPASPLPQIVTVSIGVAAFPRHAEDREGLLHAADCALYLAKGRGRDQVASADDLPPAAGPDALLAQLLGQLPTVPWGPHVVAEFERRLTGLMALLPETARRARTEVPTVQAITALAATIDAKDHYTDGHSRRVAALAVALAQASGCPTEYIEAIRVGGLLHDIGKIGIPEAILNKPGKLTAEEWTAMRAHPEIGARILGPIAALDVVVPFVRHHHECWDGAGYPLGLVAETIPLGARILAICDAYDTMVGDRPYRRGLGHPEAVLRLLAAAGTQFDPALVDQFVALPLEAIGLAPDDQRLAARFVTEGVAG
jgi:diguanylate cyclase (GGDEF)-like protein/putative nucleotidyltransferase with HDIG domain